MIPMMAMMQRESSSSTSHRLDSIVITKSGKTRWWILSNAWRIDNIVSHRL